MVSKTYFEKNTVYETTICFYKKKPTYLKHIINFFLILQFVKRLQKIQTVIFF